MPGKLFFAKFPHLYDFFLNIIKNAIPQLKFENKIEYSFHIKN
jgi:hypothetical protein